MIETQRHLFAIPESIHYINCAFMSPVLRAVEEAGIEGLRRKATPWQIESEDFFAGPEELRRLAGQLVGAPADRVCLIPAVSYGAAIVASNLALQRGQNVVMPAEEFPSLVYTWRGQCQRVGAKLRLVARPAETTRAGSVWNQSLLEAIDADTAVVALSAAHWTDGTLFDLAAIGCRAREVGAAFIVDGTQSVGALPFDFAALQPDLLLCAGYKWLLGPYGFGIAVLGERFLDAEPFEMNWKNREASEDFAGLIHYRDGFQPGARRFDVGEHSNFIAVPMMIAALRQLLEWGPQTIQDYCCQLGETLAAALADSPYVLAPIGERAAHLFGLRAPDAALIERIQAELRRRQVYVSLRGSSIRIAPHLYNNEADMAALAEGLRAALD